MVKLVDKEVWRFSYAEAVRGAPAVSDNGECITVDREAVIVIKSRKEVLNDGVFLSKLNFVAH